MKPESPRRSRVIALLIAVVLVGAAVVGTVASMRSDARETAAPIVREEIALPRERADADAPAPMAAQSSLVPATTERELAESTAAPAADAEEFRVHVEWPDHRAAREAQVYALAEDDASASGSRLHGVTDARGNATLRLRPGKFKLFAGARTDRRLGADGFAPADVAPGTSRDATIVLDPHDATLLVIVEDDSGARIPDVRVVATSGLNRFATTDAAGEARLNEMAAGPAAVRIDPEHSRAPGLALRGDIAYGTTDLETGKEGTLTIRLHRTGAIELTPSMPIDDGVVARAIVQFAAGDAHGDHAVRLSGSTPLRAREVVLDNDGVRVEDLVPGTYSVSCTFPPDAPQWSRVDVSVTVDSGRTTSAVVPIARGVHRVSGIAVDDAGAVVAGLPIRASFTIADELGDAVVKSATTDAFGRFTIKGLPRAPLALQPDIFAVQDRELAFIGGASGGVLELDGPREDVVVHVPRGYRIRGRVVCADTRAAAPNGTRVTIREISARESSYQDAATVDARDGGACTFEFRRLRAGTYVLAALNARTPGPDVTITVGPDTPTVGEHVVLTRPR